MFPTAIHEKEKVQERITSGEIVIGDEVVPSSYSYYSVNSETQMVCTNTVKKSARKIPLQHIREKLLEKHEKLGIIRNDSDEYFANLTQEEIICLDELNIPHKDSCDLSQQLKEACRTRHLKYGMTIHLLLHMATSWSWFR